MDTNKPLIADKPKIMYVEILRIIAIVFVVFNHTQSYGYVRFTLYDVGTIPYWVCMFFSVITGISVPIFFMISGMLLLGKQDETIGYIWKKRISRYVILLLVFSLWRYIRSLDYDLSMFSIKDVLIRLYSGKLVATYWFLYAYIAFLIGLPFLRKIAKGLNDKEFIYLLIIHVVYNGVLLFFQYSLTGGTVFYPGEVSPAIATNILIFYPLAGYYLGNKLDKITNKTCGMAFGLFLLASAATMYITHHMIVLNGDLGEGTLTGYFDTFRTLEVIFVFLIVRKLFEGKQIPKIPEKLILNMGGCVFGIYLIETVVREDVFNIFTLLQSKINGFVSIWIYVLLVVLISWAIVAFVRFVFGCFKKLIMRSRPDSSSDIH